MHFQFQFRPYYGINENFAGTELATAGESQIYSTSQQRISRGKLRTV
jgi:hypothetical protein